METSNTEVALRVSLEGLKRVQLACRHPPIQSRDKRQQAGERPAPIRMDDEQSFERARRGLLSELAHESQDVAVGVEPIVEVEVSDLESDRVLEARGPSEGTDRQSSEDLVRLFDELLGPLDDRVDDVAFTVYRGQRCCSVHRPSE